MHLVYRNFNTYGKKCQQNIPGLSPLGSEGWKLSVIINSYAYQKEACGQINAGSKEKTAYSAVPLIRFLKKIIIPYHIILIM